MKSGPLLLLGLAMIVSGASAADRLIPVMPAPADFQFGTGKLPVTPDFSVAIRGAEDPRLPAAVGRLLRRWSRRTGFALAADETLARSATNPDPRVAERASVSSADASAGALPAALVIECRGPGALTPTLGEDESYTLAVTSTQAALKAETPTGALRGLETLLQLLSSDADGWFVPAVQIRDQPRFPWRGLMIDVSRHWMPLEVIERNLDGMAAVKLNVLHLHLTDDQGFRIESLKYPRLQQMGSDGDYFTQAQIREIVAYAGARGIRVVPEFEMPGHATGWFVGYPELASAPGPYVLQRRWGITSPAFDPTNEHTYDLLDGFLGEMAALFPDPYVHIGGDEVNGQQWRDNPRIQAFIAEHQLRDNLGLQAYFTRRVQAILARHGKHLVGWEEIQNSNLSKDAVIQSWRGQASLATAVQHGYGAILSSGYYLNEFQPTEQYYAVDPLSEALALTPAQKPLVLGGEVAMWGEFVNPRTVDSRIWPRTAAIAERFWSPRAVRDPADLFRRLAIVNRRLDEAGLEQMNAAAMLRRFAGDQANSAELRRLGLVLEALEPIRPKTSLRDQYDPLTGLADCARSDCRARREFAPAVERWLAASAAGDPAAGADLVRQLATWRTAAESLLGTLAPRSIRVREIEPVLRSLIKICSAGEEAARAISAGTPRSGDWRREKLALLSQAGEPRSGVQIELLGPVRQLVAACERDYASDLSDRRASVLSAAPMPAIVPPQTTKAIRPTGTLGTAANSASPAP